MLHIGIAVLLVGIMFLALLAPTFIFLYFQKADLIRLLDVEKESPENARLKAAEESINASNRIVQFLQRSETDIRRTLPFVAEIYRISDGLVAISKFEYSLTNKKIALGGNAKVVKDFLAFKDALAGSSYVLEVVSPPENVVRLQNVVFTLDITLK
ncbi:MAG TPA: hypothetical protein VJC11_03985 [Patescibacteria group bacterium]|nr:hypothetical protein [Patescibacteria group bacterium]